MRYLSEEWQRKEWEDFEQNQIVDDTSDCGGWGWEGPCGGCARCIREQFGYYMSKEIESARVFLRASFDVADPRLIQLPFCGDFHDMWRCYRAKERAAGRYPWRKNNE